MHNQALLRVVMSIGLSTIVGCADMNDGVDTESEASDEQLTNELAAGKADGATEVIASLPGRILLADAPARQLYDLMDTDAAPATTFAGYRILRRQRISCVTDGVGTLCELLGSTDSENEPGFAAGVHGNSSTSASSYLLKLLRAKAGSTANAVSIPWFQCAKQGGVWCGVEEPRDLALTFAKLPPLGDDFVYEGWIIRDGATTTSRFVTTTALTQVIPASVAATATAYVVTVEPRRGDVPAGSMTHILAAALNGGEGVMTTEHPAALGTDFAAAAGSYILATPSTAAMDDNNFGVWFVIPNGPQALVLPTLPAGWAYEGWVADATGPKSTGRFLSGMGMDSDGAGPTAGPLAGPPVPGQDFIMPLRDLVGGKVVITVEPEPDTSAAPFGIKPLVDDLVEPIAVPMAQMMANTHDERPSGTVVVQ